MLILCQQEVHKLEAEIYLNFFISSKSKCKILHKSRLYLHKRRMYTGFTRLFNFELADTAPPIGT